MRDGNSEEVVSLRANLLTKQPEGHHRIQPITAGPIPRVPPPVLAIDICAGGYQPSPLTACKEDIPVDRSSLKSAPGQSTLTGSLYLFMLPHLEAKTWWASCQLATSASQPRSTTHRRQL